MIRSKDEVLEIINSATNYPPRPADCKAYKGGEVLDKFLAIGDKPGGVEPGALVVLIEDLPEANFKEFENLDAKSIEKQLKNQSNKHLAESVAKKIYNDFKNKNTENIPTVYLIKQDYPEAKVVAPPRERLKKTNAISKAPKILQPTTVGIYKILRLKKRGTENLNALLEVVGNTAAQNYGMYCQEQYTLFGSYKKNKPKIMTISRWEYGLVPLGDKLTGGTKNDSYQNYLVSQEKNIEGKYQPDVKVIGISMDLAIAILMGDRDYYGSQLQNKIGIEKDDGVYLYGFDFGHAFRENKFIANMNSNFQFENMENIANTFKNITIFMDSTMAEKMTGVFLIYRGLDKATKEKIFDSDEMAEIEKNIELYQEKFPYFKERIAKVEPNVIDRSFDEQIELCRRKSEDKNLSKEIRSEYNEYAESLSESKNIAINDQMKMMVKFRHKLQISPENVNLLENLNKLSCQKLTTTSLDGNVRLNHPTYSPKNKLNFNWHIKDINNSGMYTLSSTSNKNIPQDTVDKLNILFDHLKLEPKPNVECEKKHIQFTVSEAQLELLQKVDDSIMLNCRKQYRDAAHAKASELQPHDKNISESSFRRQPK